MLLPKSSQSSNINILLDGSNFPIIFVKPRSAARKTTAWGGVTEASRFCDSSSGCDRFRSIAHLSHYSEATERRRTFEDTTLATKRQGDFFGATRARP